MSLQREQMNLFEMSGKAQANFNQEMLEKQLEAGAKEKEKDSKFFSEFEKMLKNENKTFNYIS